MLPIPFDITVARTTQIVSVAFTLCKRQFDFRHPPIALPTVPQPLAVQRCQQIKWGTHPMRMWLDEAIKVNASLTRANLRVNGLSEWEFGRSDFEIVRKFVANADFEAGAAADRGAVADPFTEYLATMCPFFFLPDKLRVDPPYACAVQSDLTRQFIGATASTEVVLCAQEFAKQHIVTYIDVANRAALLGTTHQVRAIFLRRVPRPGRNVGARPAEPWVPDEPDELRFLAVVTPVGRFKQWYMMWMAGRQAIYYYEEDGTAVTVRDILKASGTTVEDAVADIENLTWLTLAYASVAEPAARQLLPTATDEKRAAPGRAARHRARDFSLFRVERLRPPSDCFGRHGKDAARTGTQLGRRIGVRGHFKIQRHGRANTLRKLIYVAGHFRGDMDAPPLHGVVVLRDRSPLPPQAE